MTALELLEQALADSETNLQMQVAYTEELEQRQVRLVEALKDCDCRCRWESAGGVTHRVLTAECSRCAVLREIGEQEKAV